MDSFKDQNSRGIRAIKKHNLLLQKGNLASERSGVRPAVRMAERSKTLHSEKKVVYLRSHCELGTTLRLGPKSQ